MIISVIIIYTRLSFLRFYYYQILKNILKAHVYAEDKHHKLKVMSVGFDRCRQILLQKRLDCSPSLTSFCLWTIKDL